MMLRSFYLVDSKLIFFDVFLNYFWLKKNILNQLGCGKNTLFVIIFFIQIFFLDKV